jgi:hypothetical protein
MSLFRSRGRVAEPPRCTHTDAIRDVESDAGEPACPGGGPSDHALVRAGEDWMWCVVDRTYVD